MTLRVGYPIRALALIEVKGRISSNDGHGHAMVPYSLNKPDSFILVIVELTMAPIRCTMSEIRFGEPDFHVTSVNYDLDKLLARAEPPR